MLKASAILFILCVDSMWLHAQLSFNIENYTTRSGLPQNSVLSMEFDTNGYLWFSTEGGAVRFDGRDIRVFNVRSNPELIADRGLEIVKTINGEIVLQSYTAGPYGFFNGKLKPLGKAYKKGENVYRLRGGIPSVDLHESMVREKTIEKLFAHNIHHYVNLFPLSDTTFIITDIDTVHLFNGTTLIKSYYTGNYKPAGYLMVNKQLLFIDSLLNLYKLHPDNGRVTHCKITGKLWNIPLNASSYYENLFQNLLPFNDAYLIAKEELYRISATSDSTIYRSELITTMLPEGCIINCLAFDSSGRTFAVGTDSKGLFLFRQQSFKTVQFKSLNTHSNNVYYQQAAIDSTRILTNYDRLFDTGTDSILLPDIGPIDGYALMKDRAGNIWYSSRGNIVRYRPADKKRSHIQHAFSGSITTLYEENNRIWIGSQSGLGYIDNDSIVYVPNDNLNPTYSFHEITGKGIMTGHNNGAYFLDPVTLNRKNLDALNGICVRTIEDINGLLFIGTYGNGFYLWRNDTLIKAPLDRNNNMLNVHSFFEDEQEHVWMTTNHGLFITTLSGLQAYFLDTTKSIYYYRYGLKDGIVNDEFNGGCSPTYVRLDNGLVSLPTMDGLVWFKPPEVAVQFPDKAIFIDAIRVDNIDYLESEPLTLPCDYRQLEITFSTPYWGMDENICMEYMLEGDRDHWIPLSNKDRRILISHMPFGDYSLVIRKRSGFGADDWVQITLPFRVTPHFYQTWWFISLVMLVLTGLFWLGIRIYSRNMIRRNQRLEQVIDQRTVELKNVNEDLAASEKILQESVKAKDKLISILSHDIITPLRFIGLSAKLAQKQNHDNADVLAHTLGDIQNATAKLYDNASNMLNWINLQNHRIAANPSNVAVFSLVDELFDNLSEMAVRKENELINDVSEDHILCTDPQLLGIVLSNIISNAIKHTRKGFIKISAKESPSFYEIMITDNGSGIADDILKRINSPAEDQLLKTTAPENDFGGSGLGYLLIRDLLNILDGNHEVVSEWGKGTTVILRLKPLMMNSLKK